MGSLGVQSESFLHSEAFPPPEPVAVDPVPLPPCPPLVLVALDAPAPWFGVVVSEGDDEHADPRRRCCRRQTRLPSPKSIPRRLLIFPTPPLDSRELMACTRCRYR